jgi:hypothetical protein
MFWVKPMTTITIELDEPTYRNLEETARSRNLTPAELVRNLAVAYEQSQRVPPKTGRSIRDIPRLNLGKMLAPVGTSDEILDEMLRLRDE